MQAFREILLAFLAVIVGGLPHTQAQPATPEQMNQAVELLRKIQAGASLPVATNAANPSNPVPATRLTAEQEHR